MQVFLLILHKIRSETHTNIVRQGNIIQQNSTINVQLSDLPSTEPSSPSMNNNLQHGGQGEI